MLIPGPTKKFFIVDHPKEDHNEQEFKCWIKYGILDLLKKSSKIREASYKWATIKYNSINNGPSQNVL